jgi:broad specificity phosphatase PhoE
MMNADMQCELLLIRHAESEWNVSGRWQGHADPPLSARGLAQAREMAAAVAEELGGEPVDRLLCSDLRRAVQTAECVGEAIGVSPGPDVRLRELDVGRWSGLTREEIASRDAVLLSRFEADDPDAAPGGGETRREIRARAHDFVEDLIARQPLGRVVIVTHLGFLRALLPGVEPRNAEVIRVSALDALQRRSQLPPGPREGLRSPL